MWIQVLWLTIVVGVGFILIYVQLEKILDALKNKGEDSDEE